jgi:sortase A
VHLRRKNPARYVEGLLWLIAAGALGTFIFVKAEARLYQLYLNREFENALAQQELQHATKEQAQPLSPSVESAEPAPTEGDENSDSRPYLGRLEIPRLDMSVMILNGVDDRSLHRGIGHIPGTALPGESGNAGIAGHRDTFFRGLAGIHRNDEITVQTLDRRYRYVVESVRVVEPGAVEVLADAGHPALTLVTCYPFNALGPAPRRLVVQASLQE